MTTDQKTARNLASIIGNLIAIFGLVIGAILASREQYAYAYFAMVFAFLGKNSMNVSDD